MDPEIVLLLSAFPALLSLGCAVGLGLFYFKHQNQKVVNGSGESKKINLSDVFHFPLQFWIVAAFAMIYYTTIQSGIYGPHRPRVAGRVLLNFQFLNPATKPFVAVAKPYFKTIYGLSDTESSLIDSFIYIIR